MNVDKNEMRKDEEKKSYLPHPSQRTLFATCLACLDQAMGRSTAAYLAGPSRLRNIKYFLPGRTPNRTGCSPHGDGGGGGRLRQRSRSSSCRNTSLTWLRSLLGTLPFITLRIRMEEK